MATLSKFFTNLLILGIALNISIYLIGVFGVNPLSNLQFTDLSSWEGWFDFSALNILLTGGVTAAVGIAAVLLRQGTYAIYAMLLAALSMIISPIQKLVYAIPLAIGSWLPDSTNPLPPVNGVYPPNPIFIIISLLYVFGAYWFIFGLVIQRGDV